MATIIFSDVDKDYDEKAKLIGFIETKRISLYTKGDDIPTDYPNCMPKPPCLILEKFDFDAGSPLLKPVDYIELNDIQAKGIKDWFEKK